MSKQFGFYFDEDRCVGCFNCVIACKSVNNLQTGINWIILTESWEGNYPEISRKFMVTPCLHCENPPCITACSPGAIFKRAEDGIVVVDQGKCNGCRECLTACPYSVPQFGSDGLMQKCDFCLSAGILPACAVSCPAEALKYGPLDELIQIAQKLHKQAKRLDGKVITGMLIVT
jgi:anaerobic dimethyl sulfoxide reductase subunit B (iron-sulfur subunit)